MAHPPVILDTRVVAGSGGGPDKTILNSPRFLERDGYRNLCVYMHPPCDPGFDHLRRRADRLCAPLLSVEDGGPLDWKVIPRMLNICRRERAVIWHGHDYKSNALGLLLRRFWPMKLVTTVHGWVHNTERTPLYYKVDKLCLPRYELVICVSEDLHQECLKEGVAAERCVLIENGIDTEDFRRTLPPSEAKVALGLNPARLVVGAVGRLSPEKGFDMLIRAADRLFSSGLEFDLLIMGDGSEQQNLQRLINDLRRTEQIRLLGFQADTKAYYQAMDIFALSSRREGLPNVLLEAMALEVPVVSTNIAGIPRLVTHDRNGWLIPPGDLDALTNSLQRMLTDEPLRRRFSAAGRSTIEERYSFAVRMRKVRELYDRILAKP